MVRAPLVPAAFALLMAACGDLPVPAPAIPSEPARGGDALNTCDATKYPCAPYGYTAGDVLPNLEFMGRADDNGNGTVSDDPVRKIHLSDFFQDKSIKAIAILVAAEWCGPCNMEQGELVTSWKKYQADKAGVAFLGVLIQSQDGSPADIGTVDRWTAKEWTNYGVKVPVLAGKIPFPVVADPDNSLGPYYPTPAFPMQLVVQASDMTIYANADGYAAGNLEQMVASVLGN